MAEEPYDLLEQYSLFQDHLWLSDILGAFDILSKLSAIPEVSKYSKLADEVKDILAKIRRQARDGEKDRGWIAENFSKTLAEKEIKPRELAIGALASRILRLKSDYATLVEVARKELLPEIRVLEKYIYTILPEQDRFEVRALVSDLPDAKPEFHLPESMAREGFRLSPPVKGGRSTVYRIYSQEIFIEMLLQNRKVRIGVVPLVKMEDRNIVRLAETLLTGLTSKS